MSTANYPGEGVATTGSHTRPAVRHRLVERRNHAGRELLVQRVLAEFREMPCLRLTPAQAQRLFGMRDDVSTRVINRLIADGHLRVDDDGRYAATSKD